MTRQAAVGLIFCMGKQLRIKTIHSHSPPFIYLRFSMCAARRRGGWMDGWTAGRCGAVLRRARATDAAPRRNQRRLER